MAKRRAKQKKKIPIIVWIFIAIAAIIVISLIATGIPGIARFGAPGVQPGISQCTGTPQPCSSYIDVNTCVNFAGCTFVETLTSATCTARTGPTICESYTDQTSCERVGCNWQTSPLPQPGPEPIPLF